MNIGSYTHGGWVPCINGNLFFDLVECGLSNNADNDFIILFADDNTVRITASSDVNWQDYEEDNFKGNWQVILDSEYNKDKTYITGRVYMLLQSLKNKTLNDQILSLLQNIDKSTKSRELATEYDDLIKTLNNEQHAILRIEFKLSKDGICLLKLSDTNELPEEKKIIAVRQAFYYIKYTWHKHKHHRPNDDSITTVHPIENEKYPYQRVLRGMQRSLVLLARNHDDNDHKGLLHAKGMSRYILSFLLSCKKNDIIDNEIYKLQKEYVQNTSESLEVKSESIKRSIDWRLTLSSNYRSIILFVLAFITPALLIFRKEIGVAYKENSSGILLNIYKNLFSSDLLILAVLTSLIVLYFAYFMLNEKIGPLQIAVQKTIAKYLWRARSKNLKNRAIFLIALGIIAIILALL